MTMLKRLSLIPAALIAVSILSLAVLSFVHAPRVDAQPRGVMIYSETYDAASTVDAAGITNVIAAPGAVLGDFCLPSVSVDVVDMTLTCNIQAAGLAEVRMQNESASTVDLASSTWRVMIFPHGTR